MKRILIALSALFAVAFAQDIVISPQSIVVNPLPSFEVEVFVDKDSSGNASPSYAIGEQISIGVRVSEDSYVYLFSVKSNGEIQQILPNRFDQAGQNNFVRAGETKFFPPRGARYTFNVDGPTGLDKVIAVASKRQLNTRQLADFEADPNFATSNIGEEAFARALSIIVTPIPQETWVTDTALFYVVRANQPPPAPIFGTLEIRSSPSNARAYVDGQYVGNTPVRFGTRAGSHEVRIERDGYETFRTTVNLSGGETRTIRADLERIRRTGSASFDSRPRGADVYVDGRLVGTTPTDAINFNEGNYQARFSLAGYDDAVVNFRVRRGDNESVFTNLNAQAGSLLIRANVGGARVFINGQEFGTIPSGSGRLTINDLPAGTHELVVIAPGFSTFLQDFVIRAGRTTELRVSQARR